MLYPVITYCEDDAEGNFYHAICPDFIGIETQNERLHTHTFGYQREKAFAELQEMLEELVFEQLINGRPAPKSSEFSAVQDAAKDILTTHASNKGEWVTGYEISWMRVNIPDMRIAINDDIKLDVVTLGTLVRKARDFAKQKWLEENPHGNPDVKPVLLDDILNGDCDSRLVTGYLEHLINTRTV